MSNRRKSNNPFGAIDGATLKESCCDTVVQVRAAEGGVSRVTFRHDDWCDILGGDQLLRERARIRCAAASAAALERIGNRTLPIVIAETVTPR